MNVLTYLEAVLHTLEQVSVSGAENWNKMLGCVQALSEVRKELESNGSGDTAETEQHTEADAGTV